MLKLADGFFAKWKKGIEASTVTQQYRAAVIGNVVNGVAGFGAGFLGVFVFEWKTWVNAILFGFGVWQLIVAWQNYKTYLAMKGAEEGVKVSGFG